jgi:hypothetical protein
MINLLEVSWWEAIQAACTPSSLLEIVGELYLVVGFLVVGFIALRGDEAAPSIKEWASLGQAQ